MQYTLISFYSEPEDGHYYEDAGKAAIKKCVELGIRHHIIERESKNDWIANTKMKPTFIRESMEALQEPVLWIDVDCPISAAPKLRAFSDVDFAGAEFHCESLLSPPLKIMGTTLFFNNTAGAMRLVKRWEESCADPKNADFGDHRLLSNLLYDANDFSWKFLPDEYSVLPGNAKGLSPVISLGLAKPIESRRKAMNKLNGK